MAGISRRQDVDSLLRDPQTLRRRAERDHKAAEAAKSKARRQNRRLLRPVRQSVPGDEVSPLKLPARRTRVTTLATPRELSKRGLRALVEISRSPIFFFLIFKDTFHLALLSFSLLANGIKQGRMTRMLRAPNGTFLEVRNLSEKPSGKSSNGITSPPPAPRNYFPSFFSCFFFFYSDISKFDLDARF